MRRLFGIALVLAVVAGAATVAGAGPADDGAKSYTVEFDNAFGLVEGADVKVAGVRAGSIEKMRVDFQSKRALVDVKITEQGFGDLRRDAFCETRPQSLIGEYFIDCRPGESRAKLPPGARIPVEQTGSTIPIDLVNNIMRRPYRERLRIIVGELGAGVAARGEDLNAAIRRASPALRETNRVLRTLARQNQVLRDLTEDADVVLTALADNGDDVGRFVEEAADTAAASAEREDDLAEGFRRLPGFLRELRPTMRELGRVADAQAPSLRDLNASADRLERFFRLLAPFAAASEVGFRSLGEAAGVGRQAMAAAASTVAELRRFARPTPELANNLDIVLRHLDARRNAVEPDPRSPGGKGYTGLEAFLQYVFDQSQAINIYDKNSYMLKVDAFVSKCSPYQNAESLKEAEREDPNFIEDCFAGLGPSQPGITSPDPTASHPGDPNQGAPFQNRRQRAAGDRGRDGGPRTATERRGGGGDGGGGRPGAGGGPADLPRLLGDLLRGQRERLPDALRAPGGRAAPAPGHALLDFLLAP